MPEKKILLILNEYSASYKPLKNELRNVKEEAFEPGV